MKHFKQLIWKGLKRVISTFNKMIKFLTQMPERVTTIFLNKTLIEINQTTFTNHQLKQQCKPMI